MHAILKDEPGELPSSVPQAIGAIDQLKGQPRAVLFSVATLQWADVGLPGCGQFHWSKDSRYLYCSQAKDVVRLVRLDVATRKPEEIRKLTEFQVLGTFWTPEDEPVVLKRLANSQIYRIDRDR